MKLDMEQKSQQENTSIIKRAEKVINEKEIEQKITVEKEKIRKAVENLKKYKRIIPKGEIEIKKKKPTFDISMWRVCAYFIIYSFLGYVIETLFALINYGVFECRQSFLYGPFCSIYGVGAVFLILILEYKFSKNNNMLFVGGFLVGSVVEYIISFLGEMILNVKWWDYSNRFLNINGRICLLYSIFWGILGIYLIKVVNPKIDKFLNWLNKKINTQIIRGAILILIIFLFVDCLFSAFAIDVYLLRVCVEKDLPVENKSEIIQIYHGIYDNKKMSDFINKYINNEKMIMTYPNLTVTLEDGTFERVKDYYPEIKSYYYKFEKFSPSV